MSGHGLISVGKNVEEALYRAIHFEVAAKAQILAMSTENPIKKTNIKISRQARDWRMSRGPVNKNFEYFARGNVLLDVICYFYSYFLSSRWMIKNNTINKLK